MTRLKTTFMDGNNVVGTRKSRNGDAKFDKHLQIDDRRLLQAFAVYIYIVGKGSKASEVRNNGRLKHDKIAQAVSHLKSKHPHVDPKKLTGYQSIEILIARVLLTCRHDFLMACVMQNVRNAWFALSETDPLSYSFEDMMKDLAYELYSYSINL